TRASRRSDGRLRAAPPVAPRCSGRAGLTKSLGQLPFDIVAGIQDRLARAHEGLEDLLGLASRPSIRTDELTKVPLDSSQHLATKHVMRHAAAVTSLLEPSGQLAPFPGCVAPHAISPIILRPFRITRRTVT